MDNKSRSNSTRSGYGIKNHYGSVNSQNSFSRSNSMSKNETKRITITATSENISK